MSPAWLRYFKPGVLDRVKATKRPPESMAPTTTERVFLPADINLDDATQLYKNNTAIHADRIARNYVGKWVKLTATVRDVSEDKFENPFYVVSTLKSGTLLQMTFAPFWGDRLSMLKQNSTLSAMGVIEKFSTATIFLKDCELIMPDQGSTQI